MKEYDRKLYECEFPIMEPPITRKDVFKAKLTGKPIMLDIRDWTINEKNALEDLLWFYGALSPVEDFHGWYAKANVTINLKVSGHSHPMRSNWWQRMRGSMTKIPRDEYYKRLKAEINK